MATFAQIQSALQNARRAGDDTAVSQLEEVMRRYKQNAARITDAYYNALAAGSPDAEKIKALAQSRGFPLLPRTAAQVAAMDAHDRQETVAGMNPVQRAWAAIGGESALFNAGIGQHITDPIVDLVTGHNSAPARQAEINELEAGMPALRRTFAGGVGSAIGALAASAPLALVPGSEEVPAATLAGAVAKPIARIGGAETLGAMQGLIAPSDRNHTQAGNVAKSVVAAGLLGTGAEGLSGLSALGRAALERLRGPVDTALRGFADRLGATVAALRGGAHDPVPGVERTPAQALNTPQAIAEERAARNSALGPAFLARDDANDQARKTYLATIAQTDQDIDNAVSIRHHFASAYVQNAIGARRVDPKPIEDALLRLKNSTGGSNAGARHAIAQVDAILHDPAIQGPRNTIPLAVVEGVRQGLGSIMRASSLATGAPKEQLAPILAPVMDTIKGVLRAHAPDFDEYLQRYAQLSQPINNMRTLQDALRSKALTASGRLSLAKVKSILERNRHALHPLSGQALTALENVRDSLQREADAARKVGATGSNTTADTRAQVSRFLQGNPYNPEAGGKARLLGAALGEMFVPHFGWIVGELGGSAAGRALKKPMLDAIREHGTSATETADALERAIANHARVPHPPTRLDPVTHREARVSAASLAGAQAAH